MATSFGSGHLELSRLQVARACRADHEVRAMLGVDEPFDEQEGDESGGARSPRSPNAYGGRLAGKKLDAVRVWRTAPHYLPASLPCEPGVTPTPRKRPEIHPLHLALLALMICNLPQAVMAPGCAPPHKK